MRGATTPVLETLQDEVLAGLSARIDELVGLGPNWDGEDAPAVSEDVAARTRALARQIAGEAQASRFAWISPSVAPNPDGGLELSWELGDRWVMVSVLPDEATIGCATQNAETPAYQEGSLRQAVKAVLRFLAGAH